MSIDKELELDRPMQDLKHEFVLNIVRTANLLAVHGGTLFRKYGLTEAQFNVLLSLKYKEREWTQSDLGKRLVVTRASITSVLDKLESKGLVRRSAVAGNRRIYHVCLTDKGLALVNQVEPTYRTNIHKVCERLNDTEVHEMIARLESMRQEIAGLE